jgi:tight adherence protein B
MEGVIMSLLPVLITLLLLIFSGASLFAALVHVGRKRRELQARVRLVAPKGGMAGGQDSSQSDLEASGRRAALEIRFRQWFTFGLSQTWGMRAGLIPLCLMAFGGACGAWLLLRTSLHFSLVAAVAATLAAFFLAPRAWLKHEQNGANQQFLALFPDTIDMVIRMLRAGLPVTAAIRAVANEAPPPVQRVFSQIADQMAIGIAFEDALAAAAEQVGLLDFRFFAVAISLQRATGGNLATTLDILSDIMRKRRAMRMKGKAVTGEVRMSAYVLAAIPFVVIGGLLVASPDYLQPLISDRRGNVIVGLAIASLIVGFATLRQMMRSVTQE